MKIDVAKSSVRGDKNTLIYSRYDGDMQKKLHNEHGYEILNGNMR